MAHSHQKLEKARRDPPDWRERGPAHTLILDVRPPGLRENEFLLFYATQCAVMCYNHLRKLTRRMSWE